jgi:hypothetical protein
MPRIELYVTTSVSDEDGNVSALEDSIACFVEDNLDAELVEEIGIEVITEHCNNMYDDGYDVRYCTGIIYVGKKPVMSIGVNNLLSSDNIVPLHSPDWGRLH